MGQLRGTLKDLADNGQEGDWAFSVGDAELVIRIPVGGYARGVLCAWKLSPVPIPDEEDWQWDGNREAPTLTPSLNWVGVWHGYMRAGELVKA